MSTHADGIMVYYGRAGRVRRAQAMLEYVLSLAAMLVVVALLSTLVVVALRYADRTEDLVTSECP